MYPRRVLPSVFKRVIYRLLIFYIGGVFCVGTLVSSNDPLLGQAAKGAGSSPFVLAAVRMNIPVLPHVINAIILTSAWSCGNCLAYTAARNIYSNALMGMAPGFYKKTWRGIPIYCVLTVIAIGTLSFMTLAGGAAEAFSWITNILGGLWIMNLLLQHVIYIRFRAGVAAQGLDRSQFPFFVKHQLIFSWISLVGYTVIYAVSGESSFNFLFLLTARPMDSHSSLKAHSPSDPCYLHTYRHLLSSRSTEVTSFGTSSTMAESGALSVPMKWTSSLERQRSTRRRSTTLLSEQARWPDSVTLFGVNRKKTMAVGWRESEVVASRAVCQNMQRSYTIHSHPNCDLP